MDFSIAEKKYFKPKYYVAEEDIKLIVSKHRPAIEESVIENYSITNASDKMLGFLCDYWKLQVHLGPRRKVLNYFLKAMPVTNPAKVEMVNEMKVFDKELYFYAVIKQRIGIPDLRSWSPEFVTGLRNAMVFEDMNALQYKLRNKFKRFDMVHTLESLRTLSRFHASSIIYEEKRSKELGRSYSVNDEFHEYLHKAGYVNTDNWFIQCMKAALEAIKLFSKYSKEDINRIESRWYNIWSESLALANASTEYRNVICHRDLWNNNLMFHYKKVEENVMVPDHCVLVDFQAARYQPPAGDVMLLLYCNLDPKFREHNMEKFLKFYFDELERILVDNGVNAGIIDREKFFKSAEQQRQWGVVVCACLLPQFWLNDDLTTSIFCDTVQFDDILSKNKPAFVIKMMQSDPVYKEKVMEVFEEIVERYCF